LEGRFGAGFDPTTLTDHMRIIDRYIIRNFLSTFFLMVALFCVVAVVFDVAENLERLIDNDAPWSRVFGEYYISFCLALGNMLSAFIVFLTILLFTSRLAQRSEIIAVLAGGISFQRLMRPYLVASTFLVLGSLLFAHFILPVSNQRKLDFEVEFVHKEFHIAEQHLYREISPGTVVYMRSVNAGRQVGYRFVLEQWDGDRLEEKWMASKARWLEEEGTWRVSNLRRRWWDADGEHFDKVAVLDTALDMSISDFGQRYEAMSTLGWGELKAAIQREKARGSGGERLLQLEMHTRTSNAFAIYIMTLIGVSVASRRQRGGTGIHILIGVVIGFVYVFSAKLTSVSATHAGVLPAVAAWTPNVLFGMLGIVLYRRAPK
jgi:lipopolysaccharide export system permease protein